MLNVCFHIGIGVKSVDDFSYLGIGAESADIFTHLGRTAESVDVFSSHLEIEVEGLGIGTHLESL